MEATLLIELLTEELPPKSLRQLGQEFALKTLDGLATAGFVEPVVDFKFFATPRRLAVLIPNVRGKSPDVARDVQGPSVSAQAQAVAGFARKCGIAIEDLKKQPTTKGEVYVARVTTAGRVLNDVLAGKVEAALKALPIAKLMRWGSGDAQFVRPAHGLVMLHGSQVVPGNVLGLESGNRTRGHRFMGRIDIVLKSADEYEFKLLKDGMVVAEFAQRRAMIETALNAEAKRQNAGLGSHEDLLDEVTALVEHPSVYGGAFDPAFLDVPQECLILTMQRNQKYFPLFGMDGKLLSKFLIVSNMQLEDPSNIVDGNQRVVRPRLEDARFFFEQDCKVKLASRVSDLGRVVYHNKLGSQLDRVNRIVLLAKQIARLLKAEHVWGADEVKVESASRLAKADLLTGMVGEFPELQGIMGAHYARHDGEDPEVALALAEHYLPRFAGDRLPSSVTGTIVAIADKLDAITGMFGVGQAPTGEKDPFGLRRQALGLVRIIIEREYPLNIDVLLQAASSGLYGRIEADSSGKVYDFLLDRLRSHLREEGFSINEIESVLALSPKQMAQIPAKLKAVRAFMALPEAQSLAAANKRIRNIINKSDPPSRDLFSAANLRESAEKALYDAFREIDNSATSLLANHRYSEALISLAALKAPVDSFFDKVRVNVEDQELRNNRLILLMQLDSAMNRVADLSRLAA